MIISHKHKFIFVKTHKTSTQTFMKFIKPHLGPDDVMAGDGSNNINENTKLNVDKVFKETGKSALEYQEKYGNHLPWFIIKEIVGDEIWNTYNKFTIERNAEDRIVSLFCFLNSILIQPSLFQPSPELRAKMKGPEIKELLENSVLDLYPNEVRSYFEELMIMQLSCEELPITEHYTYSTEGVAKEKEIHKKAAKKLGLRLYEVDKVKPIVNDKLGPFPYLNTEDICVRLEPFQKHMASEGQCRLLNYGYYHDGNKLTVDKVIDFNDIGNNIGNYFKESGIKINCNKEIYDSNSQNVHYRKNKKVKAVSWWYEGKRGQELKKLIQSRFSLTENKEKSLPVKKQSVPTNMLTKIVNFFKKSNTPKPRTDNSRQEPKTENSDFRVNLCTFMGREYNIKILMPYIEKALEIGAVDRYYMIDMTRKMSDHELIHKERDRLNEKFPERVFVVNGDKQKKLLQKGEKIEGGDWSPFYSFLGSFEDHDVIIKCDDDTLFIDVETLRAAAELRWKNQSPFLMHANTINNGVTAYHQWKKGDIWNIKSDGMDMYPSAGLTGPLFADLGETALKMHQAFCKDLSSNPNNIEKYKLNQNIYFAQRVSINFIFMLGKDRHELEKIIDQDEYITSSKLPQKLDRPNQIIGDFTVAHHSYGRQEELLEEHNSINFYEKLRDVYFKKKTDFVNKQINQDFNQTSPIKHGENYLFASWLKESYAIKNLKHEKYLYIRSEPRERVQFKVKGDPSTRYGTGVFFLANVLDCSDTPKTTFEYSMNNIKNQSEILKADHPNKEVPQYNTFMVNRFFLGAYKEHLIFQEECEGGCRLKDKDGKYLICKFRDDGLAAFYFQDLEKDNVIKDADVWSFEKCDGENNVLSLKVVREKLQDYDNDPTYAESLSEGGIDMHNDRGFYWTLKNYLWEFIPNKNNQFAIKVINDEEQERFLSVKSGKPLMSDKAYLWEEKNGLIIDPKTSTQLNLGSSVELNKQGTKFELHI